MITKILETILNKIDLSDIVIAILTIVGWIIAFIIMKNEVDKTHKKNLKLQDKLLARQTEYEAYKELQKAIRTSLECYVSFCVHLITLSSEIELAHKASPLSTSPSSHLDTMQTELQVLKNLHNSSKAIIGNLCFTYDFNQIVFPRLRDTVIKIRDEHLSLLSNKSSFLLSYLQNYLFDTKTPLKEKQKELDQKINFLSKKSIHIMKLLEDLSIDLQNEFLGSILNRTIDKTKLTDLSMKIPNDSGEDELRPYAS